MAGLARRGRAGQPYRNPRTLAGRGPTSLKRKRYINCRAYLVIILGLETRPAKETNHEPARHQIPISPISRRPRGGRGAGADYSDRPGPLYFPGRTARTAI